MHRIDKSVLVHHTAQQMFDLVEASEAYPDFLPWCSRADIQHRDLENTIASLYIDYLGIKQRITTHNKKIPGKQIDLFLKEGPFHILEGKWQFIALGEAACKINFELSYQFSSGLLEKLVGPVFGMISNNLIDAFVKRAQTLYANPAHLS